MDLTNPVEVETLPLNTQCMVLDDVFKIYALLLSEMNRMRLIQPKLFDEACVLIRFRILFLLIISSLCNVELVSTPCLYEELIPRVYFICLYSTIIF